MIADGNDGLSRDKCPKKITKSEILNSAKTGRVEADSAPVGRVEVQRLRRDRLAAERCRAIQRKNVIDKLPLMLQRLWCSSKRRSVTLVVEIGTMEEARQTLFLHCTSGAFRTDDTGN
jgi:hypothetical protein